jgi:two-component system, NtrC family, response regulator AtoC
MPEALLLIVEDDETISLSLSLFFEARGYTVMTAPTGEEGLSIALKQIPDTIILDLRLPDTYGIDILKEIKKSYPEISVIIMTGFGELKEAVEAMRCGAEYYFQKPIDLDELAIIVEKSIGIKQIRQEVKLNRVGHYPIIGRSKQTQGLIHMINLLAANPLTTVLIQGETGTGKELVARNIHALGSRHDKPFVEVNCAAIPDNIVESELFGYEAGAFTDAKRTKKGLIELADMGTLFLDEIGDMPQNIQAKLLRFLENRTIRRLGGTREISVDVRVIAAGNKDLMQLVKEDRFREDLFYRLNVMPLIVAPLRQRPEDIPLISDFLLDMIKTSVGRKHIGGFNSEAMDLLCSYSWPGNVRELRNAIERAVLLCQHGDITTEHLLLPCNNSGMTEGHLTLDRVERSHIEHILRMTGGNRTKAATILGLARSTLNAKIKQFDLN